MRDSYHLSGPVVTGGIYRPTHPAVIIRASNPYPKNGQQDLFGLSTRKVYQASGIAPGAVGSYPTFSPLPAFTTPVRRTGWVSAVAARSNIPSLVRRNPHGEGGRYIFCGTVCSRMKTF